MSLLRRTKNQLIKLLLGKNTVPRGLLELHDYFRLYGPITFRREEQNGLIIAISTNFRYGSIVTSGETPEKLDCQIKDAILTAFEVPSSYAPEAKVAKVGEA